MPPTSAARNWARSWARNETGNAMFSQIVHLLIQTAFGFFVYALLLRFHMQWLQAPFRNPVGQFVSALTDWIVRPARRVVPGLFGLDLASILIAWIVEALMLVLLYWLRGFSFAGAPGIAAGMLFTLAAMELVRASLYLLIGVVIVQVIISWVNPYAPLAPVFDALTRPFYAIFRSEEHTSELQSQSNLVCRLLLEKKKKNKRPTTFRARSKNLSPTSTNSVHVRVQPSLSRSQSQVRPPAPTKQ